MIACVFLGPTLPLANAREVLEAEYLPPVRQGDVYRAVTRYRPRAVGIVDGYFHQVPSVWHKEILWAMAEGVHVFGSASMGALRAAELHPFGMRGVGDVFAAYRDGFIEDDDEVAVVHGPPETGFLAASEAMVNIRRTLADACEAGVIAAGTRQALERIAKTLIYPRRSYADVLGRGAAGGLPAGELSDLGDWLEHNRVDLKRRDALAMLAAMRDLLDGDPAPMRVGFSFEHTAMWEAMVAGIEAAGRGPVGDGPHAEQEWLLDELRLGDDAGDALLDAALLRMLARREAERGRLRAGREELGRVATAFRLGRGLRLGRDFERWLKGQDLDRQSLNTLMEDEVLVEKLASEVRPRLGRYILNQLRLDGRYAPIAARARAKRRVLTAAGESAQNEHNAADDLRVLAWYFNECLGIPLPDDIDAYAARKGFESTAAFRRAVIREYRYRLMADQG